MVMSKSYLELITLGTYEERFEYLALNGVPGYETFGHSRWMNQSFYVSYQWRQMRQYVIARDLGLDLGFPGYEIHEKIVVHHIIPMTPEDIANNNPLILDPNNLITTTHDTHNAIHYGDKSLLVLPPVERRSGDTKLW